MAGYDVYLWAYYLIKEKDARMILFLEILNIL